MIILLSVALRVLYLIEIFIILILPCYVEYHSLLQIRTDISEI